MEKVCIMFMRMHTNSQYILPTETAAPITGRLYVYCFSLFYHQATSFLSNLNSRSTLSRQLSLNSMLRSW